ncbi:MAG: DUF1792 domain-containing protein [Lachnospiraceae bacterium]|nr:DUF1792 domain-containing protein [Lachnospiraceae bacterium]
MMKQVYIWGAGYYADLIYSVIDKEQCLVVGIVDSNTEKQEMEWKGLRILTPGILSCTAFDYVFISPKNYVSIEKQCELMDIPEEKVIVYWRDKEAEGLYQNRADRVVESEKEAAKYRNRFLNAPYEWGLREVPKIRSAVELLHHILDAGCSLCRFGDGEFEIMLHRERPWFQKVDARLFERMREIIVSKRENIIIAVADNFGNLEKYKEKAADDIREYIVPNRDEIISLLDCNCVYYDAYVSRPYIIYKDRTHADEIFCLFKKIWQDREVLLIEGKTARIGVGNDLFHGAKKIERMECPEKNAWDVYADILETVKRKAGYNTLICISLGPTATVLAYDLAVAGYQALDIGQLDNEYEWYIRGAEERIPIPGKMVAEVDKGRCADDKAGINKETEVEYQQQIVAEIGLWNIKSCESQMGKTDGKNIDLGNRGNS